MALAMSRATDDMGVDVVRQWQESEAGLGLFERQRVPASCGQWHKAIFLASFIDWAAKSGLLGRSVVCLQHLRHMDDVEIEWISSGYFVILQIASL